MAERWTQVQAFQIDYICDQCQKGEMKASGLKNDGGTKQVSLHVCTNCGHKESLDQDYPNVVFKKIQYK